MLPICKAVTRKTFQGDIFIFPYFSEGYFNNFKCNFLFSKEIAAFNRNYSPAVPIELRILPRNRYFFLK